METIDEGDTVAMQHKAMIDAVDDMKTEGEKIDAETIEEWLREFEKMGGDSVRLARINKLLETSIT